MNCYRQFISTVMAMVLFLTSMNAPVDAQGLSQLPPPGVFVGASQPMTPVLLQGLRVNPENPLQFDFLVNPGQNKPEESVYREQIRQNAKYFFASVALPEKSLWVNLSPYEHERIMDPVTMKTVLGEGLVSQDYILKELTSSFMHPDTDFGKRFWDDVYKRIRAKYGNIDVSMEMFNKVWIVADTASVYEKGSLAYVRSTHLKVLTDTDYRAIEASGTISGISSYDAVNSVAAEAMKAIIIPAIEQEVNAGSHFATLRQIFNGFVLAAWYKKRLKEAVFSRVYADQARTGGLEASEKGIAGKVYDRYLAAFRKGVFDMIREDPDAEEVVPRRYFSGGVLFNKKGLDFAQMPEGFQSNQPSPLDWAQVQVMPVKGSSPIIGEYLTRIWGSIHSWSTGYITDFFAFGPFTLSSGMAEGGLVENASVLAINGGINLGFSGFDMQVEGYGDRRQRSAMAQMVQLGSFAGIEIEVLGIHPLVNTDIAVPVAASPAVFVLP